MDLQIRCATVEDVDALVGILTASKAASTPELLADYDHDIPFLTNRWRSYILEGSRAQKATGVGYDPRNPFKRFYLKHGAVEINPHWAIWSDVRVIVEGTP